MQTKVFLIACGAVLAGCAGGSGSGGGPGLAYEYSTACMFENDAPGAYVFSDGDDQVTAGGGATAEGAAAINACIQRKAAADGKTALSDTSLPDVAGVGQSATTTTYGQKSTQTYTYGTPPAKVPASAPKPKQSSVAPLSHGICAPGAGVLQGGTSYCPTK
jgi:hypothetical protein